MSDLQDTLVRISGKIHIEPKTLNLKIINVCISKVHHEATFIEGAANNGYLGRCFGIPNYQTTFTGTLFTRSSDFRGKPNAPYVLETVVDQTMDFSQLL